MIPDEEIYFSDWDRRVFQGHYPGGEPFFSGSYVLGLPSQRTMVLRPKTLDSFMSAMFLVDAIAERGGKVPILILPQLPGARQDRLNSKGDFLFTAKSMAKEINLRGFPRVLCFDPHSDVMPALIDRCEVTHAVAVFDECLLRTDRAHPDGLAPIPIFARSEEGWDGVIAPDGGAEKRASMVAARLKIPLLHAWKTRDVSDGGISGFGIQSFDSERNYLMVDDICDGGGTFAGLAEAMTVDSLGHVGLNLYVSHGIFSKGLEPLRLFRNIYTTNSIINQPDNVNVIDVVSLLLKKAES